MLRSRPSPIPVSPHAVPEGRAAASPGGLADRHEAPSPGGDSAAALSPELVGQRLRLRDYFGLRPYGDSLVTPAVAVWLASAWIVILLMASLEGFVWGAVGLSLVPAASTWLAAPVGGFLFLLIFSIIWILDSSLIMSERPALRRRGRATLTADGLGPLLRWLLGLLVRVAIVAISLFVTAPFIEKLIRADDIEAYHQTQVERYFKERDATIQAQVRARAEQLDAGLAGRIANLEQEIGQLVALLQAEQQRRAAIEAEYAPQIEVVSRDLAAARARVGDEVLGRDGRLEGYGPEARKWDDRAQLLADKLAAVQTERAARLADVLPVIAEAQQRLAVRSDALQQVRLEQQLLLERLTAEVLAQQPPAAPPRLTFAARSTALTELRRSPEEAGVPHFETVTGFAQATLGVLFCVLIALKLFEPPAVRAYFSEAVQHAYRRYLAGGLTEIPGFDHHEDPARRLSPMQFARQWARYQEDPDRYCDLAQLVSAAEARLQRLLVDQAHELELLERQRADVEQRLLIERRRRELELELHARTAEAEIAAQDHKAAEARRVHEAALERIEQELAAARTQLDDELQRKRDEWAQQRAVEEDELERRRAAFAAAQRTTQEELKLRQMAQEDARHLGEMQLRETEAARVHEAEQAAREGAIKTTLTLLAQERTAQARRRQELAEARAAIARHGADILDAEARLAQLDRRLDELDEHAARQRERLGQGPQTTLPAGPLWGPDPARGARCDLERQLRQLERERQELTDRRAGLDASLSLLTTERDDLLRLLPALEREDAATTQRIAEYRERLDALLLVGGRPRLGPSADLSICRPRKSS